MTQDRATSLKNVLAGGGEMGKLMRRFDWESTCLGAVENWSHSLRTAVSILLNSPCPAFIAWGSRFIQLYNDRYIPILLEKHPQALGRPIAEVLPELWSAIGSILQNVRDTGEPTVSAPIPLFANCNGFRQQIYATFSCSAIFDESGRVGGIFVTCTETSQSAIANTGADDNGCNLAKPADLSISETVTDAFVACDHNWRYTYISKEAKQLVGKTQQELLGKSLWKVFPDLLGSQYKQEFQRSLTEQVNVEFEVFYQPFKQWIAVRAYPSGEGISIYFQTITQRKRAEQRQQAQYAVTRVLAEATTLAEAVPTLLQRLCESLGWQLGIIWSVDTQANVLRYLNSWNAPMVKVEEFARSNQQATFIQGTGLPGRIWASGQPMWIENLIKDDNFPRAALAAKERLHAAFGFPIRLGEEILGVIECFSTEIQAPDEDLLKMMAAVGSQIGQVMERKRTEEALRNSERLYRAIGETLDYGIWVCDPEGQNIYVSESFLHLVGMTQEEYSEFGWTKVLHPDDAEATIAAWQECVQTSGAWDIEHRCKGVDGNWHPLLARGVPVKNDRGEVICWAGINLDISRMKQTEQALRDLEERLRVALKNSPIAVFNQDRKLRYTWIYKPTFDFEIDQVIGKRDIDLVPSDDAATLTRIKRQVLETGIGVREEVKITMQGRDWYYDLTVEPLRDANHEIMGVTGAAIDISERKQTEMALRQSETLLNALLTSSPIGLAFLDRNLRCIHANSAIAAINNLPPGDSVGCTLQDALSQWAAQLTPIFQQVMQTQIPLLNQEVSGGTNSLGLQRHWLVNYYPVGVPDGEVLGVGITAMDITELKRVEQAQYHLAEASRVLSSSLDYQTTLVSIARLTVPQLADWCTVHLVEDDGSVQPIVTAHVNPAKVVWAEEINRKYPFDPNAPKGLAQVLRTGQSELYPDIPDHLLVESARDAEHLEILRQVGFRSVMIVPLLARGRTLGTIAFMAAESGRCYDQADLELAEELARRAGLAVDNARLYRQAQQARHRAEQAAERTARLQSVTAALSEALTPEQVAEIVVTQGIEFLGARAGVVALLVENNTVLECVGTYGYSEEMVEAWRRCPVSAQFPLAQSVRTGVPIFLENAEAIISNYPNMAELLPLTENHAGVAIPLMAEGQVLGGLGIGFVEERVFSEDDKAFALTLAHLCAQAITRARLYEAEQRARADAEAANRIKDEFLAVLSHELRSPLNPILGWTKLLRSRKLDEKATERALETIERNAKVQTQLIEDLLDVSRILQGKLVLNVCPINLVTIIEAALETVRLAAQAKDIQIETVLDTDVGQISGDLSRLQQVLWNLLSNAVKFTPTGGRVEVVLEQVGTYAQIQVKDTGKGINSKFLPYVFEYFRQENSTTTRQFGGLGLGLAIVRYLTELHGGYVFAESLGEGLGATFTVRLPLIVDDPEVIEEKEQFLDAVDLRGLRILVVDDEADIRELVAFILEQSGAEVTVATSASEALTALNQWVLDVLVSDIGMPGMDGYMLMRQVRTLSSERGGQIPAIALTAYAGEYNQQQAFAAGFQQHLAKPVEPKELVNAIARLVGRD